MRMREVKGGDIKILLDLDGVVIQYDFPKIVKDFFGVDLSAQDIFAYDLADVLGVSKAGIDLMFKKQVYGKPNFIKGALETLKEWEAKRYKLAIFSNRVKYMGTDKLQLWLKEYQIPFTYISDGEDRYDYHIDDSPTKLMGTDSTVKLLYTQPWNLRCLDITKSLKRVNSWEEIRAIVDGLDDAKQGKVSRIDRKEL